MEEYLPEWKIYLWKKLLLNREKFDEGEVNAHDFMFFDDSAQMGLIRQRNQQEISQAQRAGGIFLARRKAIEIDIKYDPSILNAYYSLTPIKIIQTLIELMDDKPRVLSITATLKNSYVVWYRSERRKYEEMEYRKRLASISMSHSSPPMRNDTYMNDLFCGLGETIFNKAEANRPLTADEFKKVSGITYPAICQFLALKLKIDKTNLKEKFDGYVDHFLADDLIGSGDVKPYAAKLQRSAILSAVQAMTGEYGVKNIRVTPEDVGRYGKWPPGAAKHYRFFETMFSLEKTGEITINDIRQAEVVVSLTLQDEASSIHTSKPQETASDSSVYTSILSLMHILTLSTSVQQKMLNLLTVLRDRIQMKAGNGTIPMSVFISVDALQLQGIARDEAVEFIRLFNTAIAARMKKPDDEERINKKGLYSLPLLEVHPPVSFPLFCVVKNDGEELEVSITYPPIVEEIRRHLALWNTVSTAPAKISLADEKRLYILERLKEEWDLAPKQSTGPTRIQEAVTVYEHRAGETAIHMLRVNDWMDQCGIADFQQLRNILITFKQEGVVDDFDIVDEYR